MQVFIGSKLNSHEQDILDPKQSLAITSKDILSYPRALLLTKWQQQNHKRDQRIT